MEVKTSGHKKKQPPNIKEMTREEIRKTIIKKRECNAKALIIVESLLDIGIIETYLLQCLPEINQSHFDDVIEERAIIGLCGYPICRTKLTDKDIPKQQYRISIKTNKVYDITTRKSFCSNPCFKAAMFLKKQMLTSPLWFREHEDIPKFNLLPLDTPGSLGREVDLSLIETIQYKDNKMKDFTSINEFASATFNEISSENNGDPSDAMEEGISTLKLSEEDDILKQEDRTNKHLEKVEKEPKSSQNNIKNSNNINLSKKEESPIPIMHSTADNANDISKPKSNYHDTQSPLNIVGNIIEKPEKKIDPIITCMEQPNQNNTKSSNKKSALPKKQPSIASIIIQMEKCLAEWFTLDSVIFLFGEVKVRELVADKGECIKEYLNNMANGLFYTTTSYDQYQQLCKKLNMLELEDRRYDSSVINRETKPLPDYSFIREESKTMELKVHAFFAGETDVPEVENTPADRKECEPPEESELTRLPLVDKKAQNALRRKIVLMHLHKILPDLMRSLGLLQLSINSDVRLLVNTFKLRANNIMFKPVQWTLIALIMIKLLSLRDARLQYLLEKPMANQHLQLLLLVYKEDGGYLDRIVSWLTDIDRLLNTNDTQLTVE